MDQEQLIILQEERKLQVIVIGNGCNHHGHFSMNQDMVINQLRCVTQMIIQEKLPIIFWQDMFSITFYIKIILNLLINILGSSTETRKNLRLI